MQTAAHTYPDGSIRGQEYLIEAMDGAGRWYILGSERLSSLAQHWMRSYRAQFRDTPLRVTENPSRRLIVLNDPRADDALAGAERESV